MAKLMDRKRSLSRVRQQIFDMVTFWSMYETGRWARAALCSSSVQVLVIWAD